MSHRGEKRAVIQYQLFVNPDATDAAQPSTKEPLR